MADSPNEPISNKPGEVLVSWEMPSHPAYDRGWLWFLIAGIVGAILIVIAIVTTNYLFAIIILILAIIIALTSLRPPEPVSITITDTGCSIGRHFYPFRDIARFALVYQPPLVQNLYLDFKGGLRPRLTIDLVDQNPVLVRDAIGAHVREDVERIEESLSEYLGRILKI